MKYFLIIGGAVVIIAILLAPLKLDTITIIPPKMPTATIIFGGDLSFDRYIREVSDIVGPDYPFSCITGTLASADLVVANLEGPITDNPSASVGTTAGSPDNFVFTFPPESAPALARNHVGIVNLGNNHILNFGMNGVRSTLAYLDAAHVHSFGDPLEHRVATTTLNGISVAFINYDQFDPVGPSAEASTTIGDITDARAQGYLPFVYTHWGVEYQAATDDEKALAHRFVDAGAEMVIGSHPHVVQEHEVYAGKNIYYSLGNFIFDQYWDADVSHGLLIKVALSPAGVTGVEEIPVVLTTDGRTCPVLP